MMQAGLKSAVFIVLRYSWFSVNCFIDLPSAGFGPTITIEPTGFLAA
jgi:hypothetical protein